MRLAGPNGGVMMPPQVQQPSAPAPRHRQRRCRHLPVMLAARNQPPYAAERIASQRRLLRRGPDAGF
ncbi:hypothetical protein KCP76_16260 [Salmonella enterica subsp. enterica serovar Weltevreden]|nr:hypothetical protein KCP76_16260 [Salmonella enterica subsp. enterica serovar Weltevreden]